MSSWKTGWELIHVTSTYYSSQNPSIWELKLIPSSLRRCFGFVCFFFLEGFFVIQVSFWKLHLPSLSVWDFQMCLNPKRKYRLGLGQSTIYNNLADILYTPMSSKSNCFICPPQLFICLPKSGQKLSEDWVYTLNLHEFSKIMNAMPLGLSGDYKQGFSSMHLNLIIVHFLPKTNTFPTLLCFFFIVFLWTTFLSFLFDSITDADYKQQQWFRISWKQNPKVVKHMLHMLYKHFHFIIVSMKIWNVWIMLEVDRIQ